MAPEIERGRRQLWRFLPIFRQHLPSAQEWCQICCRPIRQCQRYCLLRCCRAVGNYFRGAAHPLVPSLSQENYDVYARDESMEGNGNGNGNSNPHIYHQVRSGVRKLDKRWYLKSNLMAEKIFFSPEQTSHVSVRTNAIFFILLAQKSI